MKKLYEKPAVAVERFALTQYISACELKIGFAGRTCVLQDADTQNLYGMLSLAADYHFTSGAPGCDHVPSELSGENGICYHTLSNAAFTS